MRNVMRGSFVVALAVFALAVVPTNAAAQGVLYVENNNVGIGTATPAYHLDIVGTDDAATRVQVTNSNGTIASRTLFKLKNNGTNRFTLENAATGDTWIFNDSAGNFVIGKVGTGTNEMVVFPGGNMTIAGTLTQGSSRDIKTHIEQVDPLEVLAKVADLPVSTWSYRHDPGVTHLGPMAEDFYDTFSLGQTPKGLSSIDTAGVALAAIKGLNGVIEEKDAQILDLQQRVERLEEILSAMGR